MKYFTKEFYTTFLLSEANERAKSSKRAEQKDESFYREVYNERYATFYHNESHCDWYIDPVEFMKKVDERLKKSKSKYKELCREACRIYIGEPDRKVYTFDEKLCERRFEESVNLLISVYSKLPQYILNEIADIRVFALGYASAKVKKLLRPYCAELRKTIDDTINKANAETAEAESYLKDEIEIDYYENIALTGLEEKDGDIIITFEEDCRLIIKNANITEGKDMPVHPDNSDEPNSPLSMVIAAELHRVDGKFELSFLIKNVDTYNKSDFHYLTIQGTDITE